MLPAGPRDKRIAFQAASGSADDYGESAPSWATIADGERWAAVFYGRGEERRQAAATGGAQAATFVVLADEVTRTVTLAHRILFAGVGWDIRSIAPRGRAEIEFTAVRAA